MPPAEGPNLSSYGYDHVAHIGRGQYANAQVVVKNSEQLVAKSVSMENLNEADQKLSHQEVSLLQRLSHPNIVAYRESFLLENSHTLVIVMEYCEGGDLRQLIKTKAKERDHFMEEQIMMWFVQLLRALDFIHSAKILHRDLKTSNIFLTDSNKKVKLGDFGISRVLEGTTDAAVTVVGTPYYMSPEVCRSEPYNFKSDIWALGCVLYELCMLKHAFESKSLLGLVYKIVSDHYEPVPDFYSVSLNELIRRLLSKSAEHRPKLTDVLEDPFITKTVRGMENEENGNMTDETTTQGVVSTTYTSSPPKGLSLKTTAERKVFGLNSPGHPMPPPPFPPSASSDPTQAMATNESAQDVVHELLMARIRRQLVWRKINWVSALASFDSQGNGVLSESEFSQCFTSLHLALSSEELKMLSDFLLDAAGLISLAKFGARLAKAPESLALGVERFAKRVFPPPTITILEETCVRLDNERSGVLSAPVFRSALGQVLPDVNERDVTNLMFLAEKNLVGDVDYAQFTARLRETGSASHASVHRGSPGPGLAKNPSSYPTGPPNLPPLPSQTFYTCNSLPAAGPFRAMSKEYFDLVCARMQRRLGHARLSQVCALICGSSECASADSLLRVVSLVPLGVSRAEMQQIFWHTIPQQQPEGGGGGAAAAGGQNVDDVPLSIFDDFISRATVTSLSSVPENVIQVKRCLCGSDTAVVSVNEMRRALLMAQPSLTSSCLDRLLFLMDKTADGYIMNDKSSSSSGDVSANGENSSAGDDVLPQVALLSSHLAHVQARVLKALQRCGLSQEELRQILAVFDRKDYALALSERFCFRISVQEAYALIPYLDKPWGMGVQGEDGASAGVGFPAQIAYDEKKLFDSFNVDKIPQEEFLTRLELMKIPVDVIFFQDKAPDGRILRPHFTAEGKVIEEPKRKSFLSRFLK